MPDGAVREMTNADIDAKVAEKIMGWRRETIQLAWEPKEVLLPPDGSVREYNAYPNYSTDIAAAFQVVEKMRERGWNCELFISKKRSAYFWKTGHTAFEKSVSGINDLPRAICEAALAALKEPK